MRPGKPIDDAVVAIVFQRLTCPSIDATRDAWRRARSDALAEERRSHDELRRVEREAEGVFERYLAVDPANTYLKAELGKRYEAAKSTAAALRDGAPTEPSQVAMFTEEAFAEVLALVGRFEDLFFASTTSDHDRKEILRTQIERVYVEGFDREQITITICWVDGHPETRVQVLLPPYAHRLIREAVSANRSPREIAEVLCQNGIRTKYQTAWTAAAVSRALARMRNRASRTQRQSLTRVVSKRG